MIINDLLVASMFLCFIILLFSGIPVAYCLWGSALFFTLVGWFTDIYFDTFTGLGFNFFGIATQRIFGIMSNWILVAVPLFIYMGLMLGHSGLAERLMKSSQVLFGRVKGGLAVTTMLIGVLLAASTGIIGASVVMLGMISMPSMLEQGYSKELAGGTIAAAGSLGILIPPSIMLVIMADQLAVSVGDLFFGAVFPGLILTAFYIIYILLLANCKPELAPESSNKQRITPRVLITLLKDITPTVVLIITVLGSIFAGIATVTEASGVGAFAATLIAVINRRLNRVVLRTILLDTFKTVGYIMAIMIGATCFALVLRGLGGDEIIEKTLLNLPLGSTGLILSVLFAVFILGFFLDWIEITLIILPFLTPVIAGIDMGIESYGVLEKPILIWFAILVAVALQTSFLTPPVGPALFYLQGICPPSVTLKHLFKGVVPFIIIQLLVLMAVFIWPQLTTWLPARVYR